MKKFLLVCFGAYFSVSVSIADGDKSKSEVLRKSGLIVRLFRGPLGPVQSALAECGMLLRGAKPEELSVQVSDRYLTFRIQVTSLERLIAVMAPYSREAQLAQEREERSPDWLFMLNKLRELAASAVPFADEIWAWNSPVSSFYDDLWRFFERSEYGRDLTPAFTELNAYQKINLHGSSVAKWLKVPNEDVSMLELAMKLHYQTASLPKDGRLTIEFSFAGSQGVQSKVLERLGVSRESLPALEATAEPGAEDG